MNIVLLVPDSLREKANALGEAMGWGPNNYSIALSADGSEPATHWGLNLAEPTPEFLTMLQDAAQGEMPAELAQGGYPADTFAAITGALISSQDGFDKCAAANGLSVLEAKI